MKSGKPTRPVPDMTRFHDQLVNRIVIDSKPSPTVTPAFAQWALWFAAALILSGIALGMMGMDPSETLLSLPLGLFYVLVLFAGAGLAAWEAIASSLPGRERGMIRKGFSLLLLAVIYILPFFLLNGGGQAFDPWKELVEGWACFRAVSLVGLVPWVFLGWRLSKNAAFHPLWTGAWSGASAFLLGSLTVQMHCPNLNSGHIWMAHLLPVALFTLVAGWIGAFWFSRWRKN
jgi:hypothetical protein